MFILSEEVGMDVKKFKEERNKHYEAVNYLLDVAQVLELTITN